MANLNLTQTASPLNRQVSPVRLNECRIRPMIAAAAVTAGNSVYTVTASGRVNLSNATSAGNLATFRGIALNTAGIGQAVDVLEEGYLDCYDLSAVAFDGSVFVSNTAGALADAAGTVSIVAGKVVPASDKDPATGLPSKLLFVRSNLV